MCELQGVCVCVFNVHIDKLESLGWLLVMIQAYKVRVYRNMCVQCAFFAVSFLFISVLALSTVSRWLTFTKFHVLFVFIFMHSALLFKYKIITIILCTQFQIQIHIQISLYRFVFNVRFCFLSTVYVSLPFVLMGWLPYFFFFKYTSTLFSVFVYLFI